MVDVRVVRRILKIIKRMLVLCNYKIVTNELHKLAKYYN
jgi:hypothetical protein